jgi:hypothetical protein
VPGPIRTDLMGAFKPIATTATPATPAAQLPQLSAEQLITKALNGTITPSEAQELQQMLSSPEHKDAFTPQQRKELAQLGNGKPGGAPREAGELTSDLKLIKEAGDLPERFAADLVLAREALLEHPSLLRSDKATRMFQFAVPYAQAMVNMEGTQAQKLQLVIQAEKAGFKQLERQPDGADGTKVLKELLKAPNADEVNRLANGLKFDAPVWPKDPIRQSDPHHPADKEHQPLQVNASGPQPQTLRVPPPIMQPPVPIQQRVSKSDEKRDLGDTRGRLSPMTLWNALHTLRDDGEDGRDSAAQREAMTQLALAAGLFLIFFAVIVVVLVAL